jgi:hypothetical protein
VIAAEIRLTPSLGISTASTSAEAISSGLEFNDEMGGPRGAIFVRSVIILREKQTIRGVKPEH